MKRYYCDMCGKEVGRYDLMEITIEASEEARTLEDWDKYEVCPGCAAEVRRVIKEGMICQQ